MFKLNLMNAVFICAHERNDGKHRHHNKAQIRLCHFQVLRVHDARQKDLGSPLTELKICVC